MRFRLSFVTNTYCWLRLTPTARFWVCVLLDWAPKCSVLILGSKALLLEGKNFTRCYHFRRSVPGSTNFQRLFEWMSLLSVIPKNNIESHAVVDSLKSSGAQKCSVVFCIILHNSNPDSEIMLSWRLHHSQMCLHNASFVFVPLSEKSRCNFIFRVDYHKNEFFLAQQRRPWDTLKGDIVFPS